MRFPVSAVSAIRRHSNLASKNRSLSERSPQTATYLSFLAGPSRRLVQTTQCGISRSSGAYARVSLALLLPVKLGRADCSYPSNTHQGLPFSTCKTSSTSVGRKFGGHYLRRTTVEPSWSAFFRLGPIRCQSDPSAFSRRARVLQYCLSWSFSQLRVIRVSKTAHFNCLINAEHLRQASIPLVICQAALRHSVQTQTLLAAAAPPASTKKVVLVRRPASLARPIRDWTIRRLLHSPSQFTGACRIQSEETSPGLSIG